MYMTATMFIVYEDTIQSEAFESEAFNGESFFSKGKT